MNRYSYLWDWVRPVFTDMTYCGVYDIVDLGREETRFSNVEDLVGAGKILFKMGYTEIFPTPAPFNQGYIFMNAWGKHKKLWCTEHVWSAAEPRFKAWMKMSEGRHRFIRLFTL